MTGTLDQNRLWISETWEKADRKLSRICIKSREKLPYTVINGVHDNQAETNAAWWTNGFWGGMMWLMYLGTGNEEYRKTAVRAEELLDKALENYRSLHHDVGFMWHILSGARYRITGDQDAFNKNMYLAATLFSRYHTDGQYIRAWNTKKAENWSIIDCMMNLPLLYWASAEIGDMRFSRVAEKHADMVLRDHIRPNGSVYHIVEHNPVTGEFVKAYAGQGYNEDSCWSRGAAWAIYGMVLSYIHTLKREYLDAAVKTADYFIAHCEKAGYLTVIDFEAPGEPVYYDSTAGVCAACGLIELDKCLGEAGERYLKAAIHILKSTSQEFCDYTERQDALVLMGSERYPNVDDKAGKVHIPIIYGDFFYVEALFKLMGYEFLIW